MGITTIDVSTAFDGCAEMCSGFEPCKEHLNRLECKHRYWCVSIKRIIDSLNEQKIEEYLSETEPGWVDNEGSIHSGKTIIKANGKVEIREIPVGRYQIIKSCISCKHNVKHFSDYPCNICERRSMWEKGKRGMIWEK